MITQQIIQHPSVQGVALATTAGTYSGLLPSMALVFPCIYYFLLIVLTLLDRLKRVEVAQAIQAGEASVRNERITTLEEKSP